MKALYYDCFSGISGDMNLAAMIGLGVPEEHLRDELSKLSLQGYTLKVSEKSSHGIHGLQLKIELDESKDHHHVHRHLPDIENMINSSGLNENVKNIAIKIFRILGQAEAKVHNTDINKIHFHEVGAVDSILDIVGAAICIDYLKPDIIISSPVTLGNGFVKCEHGTLPVPAPATAEILKNTPVRNGEQAIECTTPTGAAILAANVNAFEKPESFKAEKIAYAIGHKESDLPNILRVYLGEMDETVTSTHEHYLIECNIDDMQAEHLEYVMDKLFEAGADDVYFTPIIMKKSRNATKLSVICTERKLEKLKDIVIKESSSFGFRTYPIKKTELERDFITVNTRYGEVNVKRAWYNGVMIKQKPEYEDCRMHAWKADVPIKDVYNEVFRVLNEKSD